MLARSVDTTLHVVTRLSAGRSFLPRPVLLRPEITQGSRRVWNVGHGQLRASSHDSTSDPENAAPPQYNKTDKAAMVLGHPFFYGGKEKRAISSQGLRDKFFGGKTVQEIFEEYGLADQEEKEIPKSIEQGLSKISPEIDCFAEPLCQYFEAADYTVEDVFVARKFIDLTFGAERRGFMKDAVEDVPTVQKVLSTTLNRVNSQGEKRRHLPVGYVLGCSGSGKTYFSILHLGNNFLNQDNLRSASFYMYADHMLDEFLKEANTATKLMDKIKQKIHYKTGLEIKEQLDMHVSIIIDEAGAYDYIRAWFEDKEMVTHLCDQAKGLAKSVSVILAGTRLTARNIDSINDAYVFRMRPWQAPDLAKILDQYQDALRLVEHKETTLTVANAIHAHPKIGALATNARAAYSVVKSVTKLSAQYHRVSWSTWLDQWSSVIVPQVINHYRYSNALCTLDADQMKRVAACTFYILKKVKKGEVMVPEHEEDLDNRATSRADIVVQWNVELVGGETRLVDGESFAVTVTPAIAVILYAILGMHPVLLPPWRADEELAACFVIRQWFLKGIHDFLLNEENLKYMSSRIFKYSEFLRRAHVLLLAKPIEPTSSTTTDMLVPKVGSGAILVNAEGASFANVIAPYALIVTKQVADSDSMTLAVDLDAELRKCCLVKKAKGDDTRLLQGLFAVWDGFYDDHVSDNKDDDPSFSIDPKLQDSSAFPDNLWFLVPERDPFEYISKIPFGIKVGDEKRRKRSLESLRRAAPITFILSSNADKIALSLPCGTTIRITETSLINGLMEIDGHILTESDRLAWNNYVEKHVLEGVKIQFLFTSNGD